MFCAVEDMVLLLQGSRTDLTIPPVSEIHQYMKLENIFGSKMTELILK